MANLELTSPRIEGPSAERLLGLSLIQHGLLRISGIIRRDGLKSLYWVSGMFTREVAELLLETLSIHDRGVGPSASIQRRCILLRHGDGDLHEILSLSQRHGCSILALPTQPDVPADSFLIINDLTVLDLTPIEPDCGLPEFIHDSTVASIYMGMFDMLMDQGQRMALVGDARVGGVGQLG